MANTAKEDKYAYYYHTNYIRNARAIAIAWALFTFCFTIILCVVLVQPFWIGHGTDSLGAGYFGLYRYCYSPARTGNLECRGALANGASTIPGVMLAATVFVTLSLGCLVLSILCMFLFLCKIPSTATVFIICGCLQIACGVFLLIGILIYPASWAQLSVFRLLCGADVSYGNTGTCQLRWVFYLAIIAVFDAIVLGVLAFILASKQDKLTNDMQFSDYYPPAKGNYSNGKKKGSVSGYPTASGQTGYPTTTQTYQNGAAGSLDRRSNHSGHTSSDRGHSRSNGGSSVNRRDGSDSPEGLYSTVKPRSERKSAHSSSRSGGGDGDDEGGSTRSGMSSKSGKSSKSGNKHTHDVIL